MDPSDESVVRETFMCLSRQHNLRKSRACESCVETGVRPPSIGGIMFFTVGDTTYDPEVGCRGCPWAFPEENREAINQILSQYSRQQDTSSPAQWSTAA